ncbi:glycoside hydrolase family 3 N-terminal domain-containing protein [Dermatobacter hominis]|uniref:glycoside hydrolase family 3 N-terminal domain-containing protein n=1 Tax=Dermatobacter hominis TaxID=2884263 RepID=UPI001D0F5667|nr:glycoside hydrolase family 3 N-terminal domain-containing protein [Dermatobacter hominis]UDY34665.1 glycoside hydrolase family 3 C-terminal domain-containing protein [Dermatobacter hominis]
MTDIDALIADMTLAEKLAQLGCVWSTQLVDDSGFSDDAARRLLRDGTGQVTRIAASTGLRPQGLAVFANEIQRFLVEETRLGIPAIIHEESVAGFCARDAVQFPQGIGLGATWDRELLHEVADHIRTEMVAVGARQSLAPVLDIARDPRWGRVEETYGEDPVLAGELGVAYVIGLQGSAELRRPGAVEADADDQPTLQPRARDGVIATGKHFLGYGLPEGGRNHGPVQLGSRELREVFAEPFAAAIRDAGLSSVMNSYSSVDGLPCAGSAMILIELLRGELEFTGTVVADYFAVDLLRTFHRIAPTKGVAAAKALLAGMDVELPALDCYAELPPLVEAGIVPEQIVDAAVRRVLAQKVALGLFEDPFVDSDVAPAAFGTPTGRALARRAAVESIVLLTNDGTVPVDPASLSGRTIAVIGPAADDVRLLQGDYHYPTHLEIIYGGTTDDGGLLPQAGGAFAPGPHYPESVTPLAGIAAALEGTGATVVHERGCATTGDDRSGFDAAVAAAASADVVVCCVGGRSGLVPDATVGEARDAVDLALTGVQEELVEALAATGTPVITVVVSGRVHTLARVEEASAATLLAWVPGQEGGAAIADVVLGVEPPAGRLPVSLPRHVGQLPVHYNHRAGGGSSAFWGDYTDSPTSPLHPFGFGLSTTTVGWSDLVVEAGSTTEPTTATVTVTNTGSRPGVEVVPLFAHDESASVARPDRQLVGFARVPLPVGESRRITFTVHPTRLAFFDDSFDFVCEPGAFRFEVGGWAGAPARTATVDLGGEVQEYRQVQVVATAVHVDER